MGIKICGIAGLLGDFADRTTLLAMLETIRHRGKDDQGIFNDGQVAIGANRLAIIDVLGGHQPVANENETIWVALNGEIYNHNELRQELTNLGHSFASRSDTEVLAHAYEEWKEHSFLKLNGMFAVAVWDSTRKELILSRDRVGIKPLYYATTESGLLFASEFKAILATQLLRRLTINDCFLQQLLEVGYPLMPETLFNEIHQVPPAHFISVTSEGTSACKYWQPPAMTKGVPSEEAIRETLRTAVVRQTISSDVPVGAFLSGGLDTSTVVAFASQARTDGLETFCMGFGEETDEFKDARMVAEAFGTHHEEILIDATKGMKLFPRMIWHSETPKVNLYSWFVNEAASKHVKVCLSGLGGDELFCGYANTTRIANARRIRSFRRFRRLAPMARQFPGRRARFVTSLRSDELAYASLITGFPETEVSDSVKKTVATCFNKDQDFVQQVIRCEFHTKLPYDYLLVEDAMSMAHTLEIRVPFLDNQLLELMLPVRYQNQMQGDTGKVLLRKAMKGMLPRRCFEKTKWGFSVDVYSWWRNSVRDYALQYLPTSSFLKEHAGRWHEQVVERIRLPADPTHTRWYSMAWVMLGLELWHRIFLDDGGKEPRGL